MKKLGFALLLSLCVACSQIYDSPQTETPKYLVNEIYSYTFTVKEGILKFLDSYGVDVSQSETFNTITNILKPVAEKKIRSVTISYNTIDPFGKPIIATGTFLYPVNLDSKKVMEVPPIARMNYKSGSTFAMKQECYEEMLPFLFNAICINPDLIGGGPDFSYPSSKYHKPFLHTYNNGRVAYDMRKAVAEYLKIHENGYQLPKETSIMGYSLGGSLSMEIARYYTDSTDIKLKEVVTGGGVYDANIAFREYSKWDRMPYPAIPYVILSFNDYFNLNLDFNRIFQNGMENTKPIESIEEGGGGYVYWYDNTHRYQDIVPVYSESHRYYMHPDFFADKPTGEFAKLTDAMTKCSIVENFRPSEGTHYHIFSSTEDDFIPYQCTEALYKSLVEKGAHVYLHNMIGGHMGSSLTFIIRVCLLCFMDSDFHDSEYIQQLINAIDVPIDVWN